MKTVQRLDREVSRNFSTMYATSQVNRTAVLHWILRKEMLDSLLARLFGVTTVDRCTSQQDLRKVLAFRVRQSCSERLRKSGIKTASSAEFDDSERTRDMQEGIATGKH